MDNFDYKKYLTENRLFEEVSAYAILGGNNPLTGKGMEQEIVEPRLGPDFESFYQFKDGFNEANNEYIPKDYYKHWEKIYTSRSGQGGAYLSPEGDVIIVHVLDERGIIGAIYVKN